MDFPVRGFDKEKDRKAVHRIWREIGWIDKGEEKALDAFLDANDALVAEVNGEVEFLASTSPGSIRYLEEDLVFSGVTAVTTGCVARKLGIAKRVTSLAIAADAVKGALVSGLGCFEQGFYDLLGYGTCRYENHVTFDPANLDLDVDCRVPVRVTDKAWKSVHRSRLARMRGHGSVSFDRAGLTRAEMMWSHNGFGFGYHDGPGGALSHHIWFSVRDAEFGPYTACWMVYQSYDQFLELMAAVRNLGDQVRMVSLCEPPGIQFQDFLRQPFRYRQLTEKSKYENRMRASAWQQTRICDLQGCLAKTHLREEVRFNLELSDPIEEYLEADSPWRGVGGTYIVTLGKDSAAETGYDRSLSTLRASVNAFSRLWLGVRPASGLAVTDDLSGPEDLLRKLDIVFRLPEPNIDWEF